MRASSFSNIKILGLDYIENQIKSIKDVDKLNTSIFSVRKHKVKDRFFGKFGKEHIFQDSYVYNYIDRVSAGEDIGHNCKNLKYWNTDEPLYFGYDPGPFSSVVIGQRNRRKKEFRLIKDFWAIHPEQHEEDPHYRKFYPLTGDMNDSDAVLLKRALDKKGWNVILMSLNQPVIYYSQHYRLLNILFGSNNNNRDKILVDENECEATISSIYHSPLKRNKTGKIELDKSSEKELEYKDQAFYSTQISSALMYLLYGEYKKFLPNSDHGSIMPIGAGTYTA